MIPSSFSRLPSIWVRSSSVSFPHCCFTAPFICFQFPSTRFQSIAASFVDCMNDLLGHSVPEGVVEDRRGSRPADGTVGSEERLSLSRRGRRRSEGRRHGP